MGTPSRRTSVRLAAFPPKARKFATWAEGFVDRLSERRNAEKPATSRRTSSTRPEASVRRRSASMTVSPYTGVPGGRASVRPNTIMGGDGLVDWATAVEAASNIAQLRALSTTSRLK